MVNVMQRWNSVKPYIVGNQNVKDTHCALQILIYTNHSKKVHCYMNYKVAVGFVESITNSIKQITKN